MTLKLQLQLQLVVKERKVAIIMRIPNHIMLRATVRNTVNVWAKIIEQELSLSVAACLPSNNECVIHDAKRGRGGRVSVTMTLIFFLNSLDAPPKGDINAPINCMLHPPQLGEGGDRVGI